MNISEVTHRTPALINQLLTVWETAVTATHAFLQPPEIAQIKQFVPEALNQVPHLIVVTTDEHLPVAFMGITDHHLDMLFVAADYRGQGIGTQLMHTAQTNYRVTTVTVNAENPQALGFYQHLGFEKVTYQSRDEQGGPHPVLGLRHR